MKRLNDNDFKSNERNATYAHTEIPYFRIINHYVIAAEHEPLTDDNNSHCKSINKSFQLFAD